LVYHQDKKRISPKPEEAERFACFFADVGYRFDSRGKMQENQ